jgi:membrane protein YdbS with pleckstrin-like domain
MEITAHSTGIMLWQTMIFLHIILFLISLIDIVKSEFIKNDKLICFISIIIVPLLGPILYLIIGKKQKIKKVN